MSEELESFTRAFVKAIRLEMEAIRRRLGPFELPLGGGVLVSAAGAQTTEGAKFRYRFRVFEASDKLAAGIECSLRHDSGEDLIEILELDGLEFVAALPRRLPESPGPLSLVIYPWFLYERLIEALEALPRSDSHFPESALAVFGKLRVASLPAAVSHLAHDGLNPSQLAALRLCLGSSVAFVWGPPGTGKTETLAHVVEELAALGRRVLVASTTNAAVDQALAKLARREGMRGLFDSGSVLRMGRSEAPSFGAELGEALDKQLAGLKRRIEDEEARARDSRRRLASALGFAGRIEAAIGAVQRELFGDPPSAELSPAEAASLFPPTEARDFLAESAPRRLEVLRGAAASLSLELEAAESRIAALRDELAAASRGAAARALVILATLSSLVVNRDLGRERFDTVIIEEAGMAVLPAVFHCAALARVAVILIGDPRQLPPIVQSSDPYARRAMGRSIFEVTVPRPESSPIVALLDLQYRMHPAIGDLVSDLYYGGRIRNGSGDRSRIAASRPCPGRALVLVDCGGLGSCEAVEGGYSRFNAGSAALCVDIAELMSADGIGSIAIVTPYAEQARLVRRGLAERSLGEVECRTVHRFQGNERDAVVLDLVDGDPFPPGVLLAGGEEGPSAEKLLNVSVSRSRGKLVVLADLEYFRRRSPLSPATRLLEELYRRGEAVAVDSAVKAAGLRLY